MPRTWICTSRPNRAQTLSHISEWTAVYTAITEAAGTSFTDDIDMSSHIAATISEAPGKGPRELYIYG